MATINPHTTRATGTILTALIYNTDHENHISNVSQVNSELGDLVAKFPGTTVDNTIPRFNGVTGDLQTSDASLTDAGVLSSTRMRASAGASAVNPAFSFDTDEDTGLFRTSNANEMGIATGGTRRLLINSVGLGIETDGSAAAPSLYWTGDTGNNTGFYRAAQNKIGFAADGDDVVYMSESGLMVGRDALIDPSENTFGCSMSLDGLGTFSRQGDVALRVKRGQDDGTLAQFYQGTSVEGVISVSGSTVTYGSFCGVHWSQGVDELLPGTILESTDEMCEWFSIEFTDYDGVLRTVDMPALRGVAVGDTIDHSYSRTVLEHRPVYGPKEKGKPREVVNTVNWITYVQETISATVVASMNLTLPKVKLATKQTKAVYGVYHTKDEDGDAMVAGLGALYIRMHPDTIVTRGDLIECAGKGLGQVQTDDVIRASTVGKVTSAVKVREYEDGSFLVPCVLYCG